MKGVELTIPMARILGTIAEKKVYSCMFSWCGRLFKYENNVFFKTITSNRILWNVLYQLQIPILLQQSFLMLCLCVLRQMALALKNEWKARKDLPITVLKAVNTE
jgi:hypothetical protein